MFSSTYSMDTRINQTKIKFIMYFPKSKIKTNLYTNGGEFIITSTSQNYIGYYWESYDGKFFTGKIPNEKNNLLLTKISLNNKLSLVDKNIPINDSPQTLPNIPLTNNTPKYSQLKPNITLTINPPTIYFPTPSSSDYQLSEFTRYFCKKTNQNTYIEISLDYYTKLLNQDPTSLFTLYFPFKMQWKISGDKEQVFLTNKNMTKYTENQFKLQGLGVYLKDYLKFYKA
jgi:hypothetical protein